MVAIAATLIFGMKLPRETRNEIKQLKRINELEIESYYVLMGT